MPVSVPLAGAWTTAKVNASPSISLPVSVIGKAIYEAHPDLYPLLIKPSAPGRGDERPRPIPPPYVIAPLTPERTTYQPGQELAFDLTLVGWAMAHLGTFIEALQRAEKMGLGADRDQGCGRFYLSRVMALEADGARTLILERGNRSYYEALAEIKAGDIVRLAECLPAHQLTVRFLTPTYLQKAGAQLRTIGFQDFLKRLAWRQRLLMRYHCNTETDFRSLVEGASSVETRGYMLTDVRGERYSREQSEAQGRRAGIPLDGFVGTVTFGGDLTPFRPLLVSGQWLHVGKNTVRGHGRFRVEAAPA